MTEDSDLEGLAGDLANLDLGDVTADAEAPAGGAEAGGGEGVELDDDLQAMLNDTGGEQEAAGEEDEGGGPSLDDMLAEEGAGGGDAPAAQGDAPVPAAPPRDVTAGLTQDQVLNLEFLLDIKLHVTFEVGRSKMLISDLLTLGQGSVIELHRLVGDELDLLINGKLVAKGEVVVVNEKFGCKITDIIAPEERVKHMGAV